MKHIRKFNEIKTINYKDMTTWGSTETPVPKKDLYPEMMDMIFADFIDNGAKSEYDDNRYNIKIMAEDGSYSNIDLYLEYTKKLNEMALDMKTCINRVQDECPTVKVRFYFDDGYDPIGGSQKDAYYEIYFDNR